VLVAEPGVDVAPLIVASGDLDRSLKIASKLSDHMHTQPVDPVLGSGTVRFLKSMDELRSSMEAADVTSSELNFVLKYKKRMDGTKLTPAVAEELRLQCSNLSATLVADMKSVRCHAAPKPAPKSKAS
jgi:hypothetical protein